VSTFYDPLLAKIIVHGGDRAAALRALDQALASTEILGPRTNLRFLSSVIADPVVQQGRITTDWLEHQDLVRFAGPAEPPPEAVASAAAAEAQRIAAVATSDPFEALGAWRATVRSGTTVVLRPDGQETVVRVPDGSQPGVAVRVGDAWLVWAGGDQHEIEVGPAPRRIAGGGPAHLGSPLPGRVVGVRIAAGDVVAEGDELVVVEAMKMEHAIRAPADGVITGVLCSEGEQVDRGQPLVDFEPAG
jgi:acetyl-CoA/propionyl-CoA carboxylase biotin carboxyl carrier protein